MYTKLCKTILLMFVFMLITTFGLDSFNGRDEDILIGVIFVLCAMYVPFVIFKIWRKDV